MGKKDISKIEKIADMAAERAVKKFKEDELKKKRSYRFRNTKLLLKNYNLFQSHIKNAKDDIKDLEDSINLNDIDISASDELHIQSIRDSKFKTLIIIAHIDSAMEQLKLIMRDKKQYDKYQVVKKIYIDGMSFEDAAKDFNCGHVTARRWEKEAVNELSILLFGVDGMKLDK